MPRLNYGTLLENVVVLEATRTALRECVALAEGALRPLAFASSFAMPPLTQCWVRERDGRDSPAFTAAALRALAAHPGDTSLASLWARCVANEPALAVCRHTGEAFATFDFCGPNGALLAAMLASVEGRTVYLWVNDDGARYGEAPPGSPRTDVESPRTLEHATSLLGRPGAGSVQYVPTRFPFSVSALAAFLSDVPRNALLVGFLDPDNYGQAEGQVSSADHERWLGTLGAASDRALSIMFMSPRPREAENTRWNERLSRFHADCGHLFPRTIVFEYGNYAAGVKVRWPAEGLDSLSRALTASVNAAWSGWRPKVQPLGVRVFPSHAPDSAQ